MIRKYDPTPYSLALRDEDNGVSVVIVDAVSGKVADDGYVLHIGPNGLHRYCDIDSMLAAKLGFTLDAEGRINTAPCAPWSTPSENESDNDEEEDW